MQLQSENNARVTMPGGDRPRKDGKPHREKENLAKVRRRFLEGSKNHFVQKFGSYHFKA